MNSDETETNDCIVASPDENTENLATSMSRKPKTNHGPITQIPKIILLSAVLLGLLPRDACQDT